MLKRLIIVTTIGTCLLAACGSDGGDASNEAKKTKDAGQASSDAGQASNGGDPSGFGDDGRDASTSGARSCANDLDCGSGGICLAETKTCSCGAELAKADVVAPNVLIVLDRSCSMTGTVAKATKWQIAVSALEGLIKKNDGALRFGLELFPDRAGDSCSQDAMTFAPDPTAGAKIVALLLAALDKKDTYYPNGPCVTNIYRAIAAAAAEPTLQDKTRGNYIVLLTDGQQGGCGGGGDKETTDAIQALHSNAQVDTFVLGFGSGVDTKQMDIWADAGGQPRKDAPHKYYDTTDQASLEKALDEIAGKARSCSLHLSSPPPDGDPGLVYVFLDKDKTPRPRDTTHAGQWDYDAATQTVTLYGAECEGFKNGTIADVNVVFGCPGGAAPQNPVN